MGVNYDSQNSNDVQNEAINKDSPLIQLPPPTILKPLKSICKIDTSNQIGTGFLLNF